MKTVDEHGTTVYFNIPDGAVVTASEDEILIRVQSETTPVKIQPGKAPTTKPFMRFAKLSSTNERKPAYFYLQDNEFTLLQKEIEQIFAKPTLEEHHG